MTAQSTVSLQPDFAEAMQSFIAQRVLGPLELHVVDQLAHGRETDRDVLLALALAVRAPRTGHVCVELDGIAQALSARDLNEEAPPPPLAWPADLPNWRAALLRSPLVREGDAEARTAPFVLAQNRLYMQRYWHYEARLAAQLQARAVQPLLPYDPERLRADVARLLPADADGAPSRAAIGALVAVLRGLTVITGGPGTGKTWTVGSVVALLHGQWQSARARGLVPDRPLNVALAAPTGKAAARMREALLEKAGQLAIDAEAQAFLSGLRPSTLHRLLGWNPGNTTRFRYDATRPLPHDVVVVDEASMVDLAMMCHLTEAVRPDARLLLLGDRHQLASVEAGSVLADVCGPVGVQAQLRVSAALLDDLRAHAGLDLAAHAAAMPAPGLQDCIVALTKNHRFQAGSGIAEIAGAIVTATPDAAGRLQLDAAVAWLAGRGTRAEQTDRYPDVALLDHAEGRLSAAAKTVLCEGYRPYLQALHAGAADGETEMAFHARVLAIFDDFRVLCAHREGRLGVAGLNTAIEGLLADVPSAERLQTKGRWYLGRPVLIAENDYAVKRFNGDIGLVVQRQDGARAVAFPGETAGTVEYLSPARLPAHETVFAMTIHKSQGSQFAHPVVVLPDRASPILTRELVYTGLTRARSRVTVLGSEAILRQALDLRVQRASGLGVRLWGE